ncbi:MAG: cation diffusion facilitator family transporter [Candidatus Marinimicrobia bacterium]|nr:cation diffusion facilitator family transporter [Candidatus Neomarinimicrobiota bacterium]
MHQHHEHAHSPAGNISRAFYIGIILNTLFMAAEFVIGYYNNSLALIADAGHNFSDVISLFISLIGLRLAYKAITRTFTYGYKKASILASLINAVLLVVVVIYIFKEGIERLNSPPQIPGNIIMITAGIGVLINTISAFLFYKGQKEDINIKAAFIHLLVDALVSVGVVVSGLIIMLTGWHIVDTVISFIIGGVILVTTWGLLKESLRLTLDAVPKDIDTEEIKKLIIRSPRVKDLHHLHIWALSSRENALTAHIILDSNTYSPENIQKIKNEIKNALAQKNIRHVTLEIDSKRTECNDISC